NVLVILRQASDGVNPHEIADRLLVTRAAVTAILDALEAKGLVRRDRSGADGRMSLIAITAAGKKLLDGLLPEHFAAERAMASVWRWSAAASVSPTPCSASGSTTSRGTSWKWASCHSTGGSCSCPTFRSSSTCISRWSG